MSFAAYGGRPWELADEELSRKFTEQFPQRYEDFNLVRMVDGVPVLRMKNIRIDVIRYEDTDVPKQVRIRVRSQFSKPKSVAELYKRTLLAENLQWDHSTGGSIEWDATAAELTVTLGPATGSVK